MRTLGWLWTNQSLIFGNQQLKMGQFCDLPEPTGSNIESTKPVYRMLLDALLKGSGTMACRVEILGDSHVYCESDTIFTNKILPMWYTGGAYVLRDICFELMRAVLSSNNLDTEVIKDLISCVNEGQSETSFEILLGAAASEEEFPLMPRKTLTRFLSDLGQRLIYPTALSNAFYYGIIRDGINSVPFSIEKEIEGRAQIYSSVNKILTDRVIGKNLKKMSMNYKKNTPPPFTGASEAKGIVT